MRVEGGLGDVHTGSLLVYGTEAGLVASGYKGREVTLQLPAPNLSLAPP